MKSPFEGRDGGPWLGEVCPSGMDGSGRGRGGVPRLRPLGGGGLVLGVELGAHGGVSVFGACPVLVDPVSSWLRAKTLGQLPSSPPPAGPPTRPTARGARGR